MSERPDTYTISFRVEMAGRRALLRNAMIGAAIAAVIGAMITTGNRYNYPLDGLILPLLAGAIAGIVGALGAWVGQVAARSDTVSAPINWRAVAYSGLIIGWISLIGAVIAVIGNIQGGFGLGLFFTTVAILIGVVIAGGLTLGVSSVMRVFGRKSPQQLGEGQFDPLGQVENARENVYHRR